jgi:hypothetical protein
VTGYYGGTPRVGQDEYGRGGAPVGAAPAPPGQAGPSDPYVDPYDFSTDPILQKIKAASQQRMADAQARAIRLRGEEDADYADVQRHLAKERVDKPRQLTESLNDQNLFYSGAFGKQQTELATSLLDNEASAQRTHDTRLGGINDWLLGSQRDEESVVGEGEEGAAGRLAERLGDLPIAARKPGPLAGRAVKRIGAPARPLPRFKPPARIVKRGLGF